MRLFPHGPSSFCSADLNSTVATVVTVIVHVIAATLTDLITTFQGIIQVLMIVAKEEIDAVEAQAIQTDHPTVVIGTPETGPLTAASAGPALGMTPRTVAMDMLMAAETRMEAGKAARSRMANTQVEASWEGETVEDAQVMEMEMMTSGEMKGLSRMRLRII